MTRVPSLVLVAVLAACGTQIVRVEPVRVEPIHMTVDINLHDGTSPGTATGAGTGAPRR